MILYHGSNVLVSTPKILVTNRMLDFGAGFYTTSNRQQAVKWAKTQTIRRRKGKPIVSMYDFDEEKLDGISVCRFESADKEWLNFVADNRKGKYVGEKYDLNSSIPNNTAAYYRLYYSNNTSIAPVQKAGGLVTAKTAGTTTIRCKLSNGKEAICKVTVKSAPSRVTVSDKSATLKVGQSKTLKATLNNNAYSYRSTWTSSNTYVATVNSTGKISAKSQGTATITYKTYNGKTASCKLTVSGSVAKCIDVSTWQGSIDFNKVKSAGYDYVIIRAGYGKEKSQKDNMFETNYKKAKSAGLKVGAYWFSYAMSPSTATAEADACLSCIKGKKFELPVYYDMEYQPAMSTSNSNYTKMAVNFCNKLKSNGFKSGVYSSASVYDYLLNRKTLKNNGISIWNAEWYTKPSITCDVWQYSDNGRINGISTNVDLNYIYNLNIVG